MFFGRKKTPPKLPQQRVSEPPASPPARPERGSIPLPMAMPAAPTAAAPRSPVAQRPAAPSGLQQQNIPGVQSFVAIASGKGGVGKSTVSVNLAVALAQRGVRVGLLDADIYGPSIPALMGLTEQPRVRDEKIMPLERHGVHVMSLGLLVPADQATIWRGPMVGQAVQQLLRDVDWGELDYLLIDLPPGTGDAPLSLSQALRLTGVVVVSTPQDVALNIATRSVAMFKQLKVPIVGIVENMSYFICPHCHERHAIFGHGGAQQACERLKVPFLGEVPLHQAIREGGDTGTPVAIAMPGTPEAAAFASISESLTQQVSRLSRRSLPMVQMN